MSTESIRILTDEPTTSGVLDFDKYSTTLANIIVNSRPRFTVGVFGGWGTGKTTLMRMIKEKLDENEKVLTVWFNAWRYEREEYLAVVPLLRTIRLRLEGRSKFQVLKLALEAGVNAVLNATKAQIGGLGINFEKLVESARRFGVIGPDVKTIYYDALGYFDTALSDLRRDDKELRIVVFVDDLDRCSPERTLEVLESIKAFLDLDGIVFVLGMDVLSLETLLKRKYGENPVIAGSDYIEKIVQLPFPIPDWVEADISTFIDNILNRELKDAKDFSDSKELLVRAVEWNPRQVKRFINSIILAKAVFAKPADRLMAVQALRFRNEWGWLLELIMQDEVREEFLNQYIDLVGKDVRAVEKSRFGKQILRVRNDDSLTYFLDIAADKLLEIENMEEYRRALETVSVKEDRKGIEDIQKMLREGRIEQFNKLRSENPGARIDLSRANLPVANLSGVNLSDLNLTDANFYRARLFQANLSGADLSRADLSHADLPGVDLSDAKLSDAKLTGSDLIDANLSRANLSGAKLYRAKLHRANLTDADLSHANLPNADLSDANLYRADLSRADLSHADLSRANLIDANLNWLKLIRAETYEVMVSEHTKAENIILVPEEELEKSIDRWDWLRYDSDLRRIILRDNRNFLKKRPTSSGKQ